MARQQQCAFLIALLAFPHLLNRAAEATEPQADITDLPRVPPTEPADALATFEIKQGLALDLVAHEPLVEDPIAIDFDEDGRMFVVEMRGYSEQRDAKRGRIRFLVDTDDDGTFDRAAVFAGALKWPTSVCCFDGGVFVAETPDILYLKDTDGDGHADTREVVFTGFGAGKSRLNVQAIVNGLQWGPDNRIWGATSMNGGKVRRPVQPESEAVNLNGSDFSFDPRIRDLRAENGTAQNGMSFDSQGRRFVCSNSNHLIAVMWERPWLKPNLHYQMPNPLAGIALDGGAAPVFRISPDEPWRVVRTRWRVAGVVGGPVEGGGRVSGYFTGASGVTIYTGDAPGGSFRDNAFIGDVGSNLVHRKIIREKGDGPTLEAVRPDDEKDVEFLASRDNWFRPTNFANGPDGCLYVVDMYREIIEHPWSLPPGIKRHLDLNSGNDRGRIYRVRPESFERRKTRKLSKADSDELAALLDHPNGWHRRVAQRLLWERGDTRAAEGWAPSGKRALKEAMEMSFLDDRERAIKLDRLVSRASGDTWLGAAFQNALTKYDALRIFTGMAIRGAGDRALYLSLAEAIGKMGDPEHARVVLVFANRYKGTPLGLGVVHALGKGLAASNRSLTETADQRLLKQILAKALAVAAQEDKADDHRKIAIELAALAPNQESTDVFTKILRTTNSGSVQIAAMAALNGLDHPSFPDIVIGRWEDLDPRTRARAINLLLAHPERATHLLSAIRRRKLAPSILSPNHVDLLRRSPDVLVSGLVQKLFPPSESESRESVIARYRKALDLKGDAKRGETKHRQLCISCHRSGNEGFAVGPDTATFKAAGPESILTNLFDPNREVAPRYQAYAFTLTNGESLLGIIARETPTHTTIRQSFGADRTLPRKEIASMKGLGKSLMPEGLEEGLSAQDVADLLAWIAEN